jgi:uncharacterized protein YggU (UPF0235/DUF167 family)
MPEENFFTVQEKSVSLRVKAKPGARQDAVLGVRGSELLVAVRAVAEKGKANVEIVKVIAKALGMPRDSIVLKLGGGSPHKVFQVPLEAAPALRRLRSTSS